MQLQRTTWILLLIAAFMGGAVYFYEGIGAKQRQETETAAKRLLPMKSEADVTAVTLKTAQYTLSLSRVVPATPTASPTGASPTGSPSPTGLPSPATGLWTVAVAAPNPVAPKPANTATVDFLVNLLVSSDRQPLAPDKADKTVLTIPATQKGEFGFVNPFGTLDIQLKDGKTHQIILGQPNFNRSAFYAQVDPPATDGAEIKVVLVPIGFENALQRPLAEWYPAPATPTPQP